MYYQVTSVHSPEHDAGIRWDSADIPWPILQPVLSERDASFPALKEFTSPFKYREVI
jgi:dTDP-4-dehydrorhamnose 3,5-epimerase